MHHKILQQQTKRKNKVYDNVKVVTDLLAVTLLQFNGHEESLYNKKWRDSK
jgi:hypothetical protein